ncbi:MAG: dihydrolipoyl dehydrogenase [Thermodesulfobacteriota bacterium]
MTEAFDLTIIGGGPAGYTAAVRASRLGMKTVCIDRSARLGGVCLNVGCIPSKALLDSSEVYDLAVRKMHAHGVITDSVRLDLPTLMQRKDAVVRELTGQLQRLLETNRVTIVTGEARLIGPNIVEIRNESETKRIESRFILIATGSRSVELPMLPFDGSTVVDSTGALSFSEVPKRLAVIGGGAIGLELGSVWQRLGAMVTVIELMPQILPNMDGQIARTLKRVLGKQGMQFLTNTKLTAATIHNGKVELQLEENGKQNILAVDKVLVAVGRTPNIEGIGLSEVGVAVDTATRRIVVDAHLQTTVSGIYAAGDVVAGPMLAHKAMSEGVAAVEAMAGQEPDLDYGLVPSVVYTSPEVASVGYTEEWLKARGSAYVTGVFPYGGNGRAWCAGETEGIAKIIAHAASGRILGVHILGPRASDIIMEGVLAIRSGMTARELLSTVHAHPTFSEAVMDAAGLAVQAGKAKPQPK